MERWRGDGGGDDVMRTLRGDGEEMQRRRRGHDEDLEGR